MSMTGIDRTTRVQKLTDEAHQILDEAITEHITDAGKSVAGVVVLFSGGNDSTVLAHLFRERATHAAHANTTIGIEQTRQFVRDTCREWGLPLLERTPGDGNDYRTLVTTHGFPGPGHHFKMYQRLKERALRQVRRELVTSKDQRVVFVAGRRRSESKRREQIPAHERVGSVVWASPLVDWTTADLNTYRLMMRDTNPVPVNEVSDLIHMSGECLCGSFAQKGEREELAYWFPEAVQQFTDLETEIANRSDIPQHRRKWGWGAYRTGVEIMDGQLELPEVGPLCSSCDARFQVD